MATGRKGEWDRRGSMGDRAARKWWMLRTWGDGQKCPCVWCECSLDYNTVQADRIVPGGSYRRDNVQPSCADCNNDRGDRTVAEYLRVLARR